MTAETLDVFRELGIDPDEIKWQDLALCHDMETNLFYDSYESDEQVANMIDEVCLSCPVMRECMEQGIDNKEYGVWGGMFLNSGKVDKNRNAHKSKETWQAIGDKVHE